jgi:drug/metabolite transporter (DMT)-like permease
MLALSFGLSAALCWSIHDSIARFYADRLGPYRMALLVIVAGAFLLLPIVLWRGLLWQAEGWALGYAAVLGGAYAMALAGLFKAFSLAPVSIVAPTTAGYPALVVVWGLLNGLVPTAAEWAGLVLVLAGAIIVGASGSDEGERKSIAPGQALTTLVAIIAANLGFAAAVVLGQAAAVSMGEVETTFVARFPAALLLLLLLRGDVRRQSTWPSGGVVAVLAMATLDVGAMTAVNYAGHFPNKAFAAMGVSAYGGLAVLVAMIVLKERVSKGQWLGIALIVAGIACLGWPKG